METKIIRIKNEANNQRTIIWYTHSSQYWVCKNCDWVNGVEDKKCIICNKER